MKDTITNSENVDYFQVLEELWQLIRYHIPAPPKIKCPERLRADYQAALK